MNPSTTQDAASSPGKGLVIFLWILQILAAAAFFAAGGPKLTGAPMMVAMYDKIGVGQWFRYLTGILEISGAISLLVPRFTFYGAALLAVVMLGAITAHLTVLGGNPAGPVILLLLTTTIAYLRRPR